MLNVDNKKAIKKLSGATYRANKLRNIIAIMAIILTTLMFTSLFTIGSSILKSVEEATMRQVGGSDHAGFKYLSMEEYDRLKTHKSIKDISYSVVLANPKNKDLVKRPSEIRFTSDERTAKVAFSEPTTGHMPRQKNEVALDTLVLDRLGLPHELGQTIRLEYSLAEKNIVDDFKLVGYWEGDAVMQASMIWVSPEYGMDKLKDYVVKENDGVGAIDATLNFANANDIEGKILKVIKDSGYGENDIEYGINWAYIDTSAMDMGTVLISILGVLIIILCGYLIISNIFSISISRDIRYYGLLKTIGTTEKQIKKIVLGQATKLCIIGIPIGLILGFLLGSVVTPFVMGMLTTSIKRISINPMIFIGGAIFAILTVLISVRKSSKMAAKVSPIEALRNTEANKNSKKMTKKSGGVNLAKMAKTNIFRNKKKAILVTLSLSLSLIILNTTYSLVKSFDMDKYLSNSINTDFVIADAVYSNVAIQFRGEDTLSDIVINDIKAQDGIEEIGSVYFKMFQMPINENMKKAVQLADEKKVINEDHRPHMEEVLQAGQTTGRIYGMDKITLDLLTIRQGKLDLEKFATGDFIIVGTYDDEGSVNYYEVGEKVKLDFGNGKEKEYEVMAVADVPYNISVRNFSDISPNFVVPGNEYLAQLGADAPMTLLFNVNDEKEEAMEAFLQNYCEEVNVDLKYESKKSFVEEFKGMQNIILVSGIVISLIIGFIGIINFINTTITSIESRRRELAMLQGLGMTGKQMKKMLVYEGLNYVVLTAIFSLTIGSALGSYVLQTLASEMWMFSQKIIIMPILICLPILIILAAAVPLICFRLFTKHTIVERLRENE